jgi:hypothetical protein
LDTVGFDMCEVLAARVKEPVCSTFANTAHASRSGRFDMLHSVSSHFNHFHFVTIEQAHRAAECDKAGADLANGVTVVLAEIGNRPVIWREASRQPHHLDITSGLALQPKARSLRVKSVGARSDRKSRSTLSEHAPEF